MLSVFEKMKKPFYRGTMAADKDYTGEGLLASEETTERPEAYVEIMRPDAGELQRVKTTLKGHGEQTIIPDECQYGDNDLCYVES